MRKVSFKLSQRGRAAAFVAGGRMPGEDQVVEVDLEQATPEQRQVLLTGYKAELLESYRDFLLYDLTGSDPTSTAQIPMRRELDAIPTAEQALMMLVEQVPALLGWRAESERHAAARKAAYEANRAREEAMREAVRRENEKQREAEAAAKAERDAVKSAWINEHGSDHLRRAFARGHDCQRPYVIERAAKEAPGYVVDFENSAEWKARSYPSVAALDEVDGLEKSEPPLGDTEIVWLTSAAKASRDDDDLYGYEPCEAIVIRNYLGKYILVKVM